MDVLNRVYVADTGNKRVRVYDAQGTFLYNIGQGGASLGQLDEPVGIAINQQSNEIFVADTWNKRIDIYDLSGAYRRSWPLQAWGATKDTGSRPYLAFDKTGTRLFVTDPDAGRVLVFDNNGVPLMAFGSLAAGNSFSNSQFGALGGIAVDNEARVFLVDSAGGRILRFAENTLPGILPPVVQPMQPATEQAPQEVF